MVWSIGPKGIMYFIIVFYFTWKFLSKISLPKVHSNTQLHKIHYAFQKEHMLLRIFDHITQLNLMDHHTSPKTLDNIISL